MRSLSLLLSVIAFACLVLAGCSGRQKCACPGCDQVGNKPVLYYQNGDSQREVAVWMCPEHADKAPWTWPGAFLEVGRAEQNRKLLEAKQANEEAQNKARTAWEQGFPENRLERSGEHLVFKPRFTKQPRPGTTVGFVYSQPGGPALDEVRLRLEPIHFDNAAQLGRGKQQRLDGMRVTVVVPLETPIVDGQMVTFQQQELMNELAQNGIGAPMGGEHPGMKLPNGEPANIPSDQITGAIAEFERGPNELRLIGFLTPVCAAHKPASP